MTHSSSRVPSSWPLQKSHFPSVSLDHGGRAASLLARCGTRAEEQIRIAGRPSDALALRLGSALRVDHDLQRQTAMDLLQMPGQESDCGRVLQGIAKDWPEVIDAAKATPTPALDDVISAAYQWVAGFMLQG